MSDAASPADALDPLAWPEAPRRRRVLRWALAALAAVALAVLAWLLLRPTPAATAWRTAPVERRDIVATVTATAVLDVRHRVHVSAPFPARVLAVLVAEDAAVDAGQPLLTLDTTALDADVARLEAERRVAAAAARAAAEARAAAAAEKKRVAAVKTAGLASAQALEQAAAAAAAAAAEARRADAALAAADTALAAARARRDLGTLRAPAAGVVLSRDVVPGQHVAPGPPLFVLGLELPHLDLVARIDEADVGLVRPGAAATFTVDAFPGRAFATTLAHLGLAPLIESGTTAYEARLPVDNPDAALRPGMHALVKVETGRAAGALAVPEAALRFVPPDTPAAAEGARVFRPTPAGAPEAVPVAAGLSDGVYRQIAAPEGGALPLDAGDRVIVGVATGEAAPPAGASGPGAPPGAPGKPQLQLGPRR